MLPKTFWCELPEELVANARAVEPKKIVEVGIEWTVRQSKELLKEGVPSLHYYIMQNTRSVGEVLKQLKG